MSVEAEQQYTYEEHPPLIEIKEVLEGMTPEQLQEERERLLSEMSDRETLIHQINGVLAGYGLE